MFEIFDFRRCDLTKKGASGDVSITKSTFPVLTNQILITYSLFNY